MFPAGIRNDTIGPILHAATLALAAGTAIGVATTMSGPALGALMIAAPLGAVAVLRSIWAPYATAIGILALAPFAVVPFHLGVRPTLLSVAIAASLIAVAATVLVDRREQVVVGGVSALVLILIGVSVFAFVLGAGRGYSSQTMHDFAKFVLAIITYFITVQLLKGMADVRRWIAMIVSGIGIAGVLALALYAGGPSITFRVLARLIPYGYPSDRIVRYIEDDPMLAMRAVGTSVDPNSFGGLLMVGFVISVSQLVVRRRSLPVWLSGAVAMLTAVAMLLTYSRGAWVGALAGVAIVVLFRRPVLLIPAFAFGTLGVAAGIGSGFVTRLWMGFTLQDPATRLRLSEYRNAWDIIRRHPWFGVGFGDAPTIDLQVGVSSVYLTIAERAGLIGLGVFLVAMSVVLWRGLRVGVSRSSDDSADAALTLVAALAAMLTVGLVDHYFFNPQFPHMAALMWIVVGSITAISRVSSDGESRGTRVSCVERIDQPSATGARPAVDTGK